MLAETQARGIRVLIADDHGLLVDMVQMFLEAEGSFSIARSDSLEATLAEIAANGPYEIVLLDLDMPGMHGLVGVEHVVEANAGGAVVLFSGQARQEAVFRALELGVRGYIPKTLASKSLGNALRFVASGEVYLPSAMATSVIRPRQGGQLLSVKEEDVMRGICAGLTNKEIAQELGMTEITVKMHVRSICSKLSVSNRTQIAMTALARGLL